MNTPERHGFERRPRLANLPLYQQATIAKTAGDTDPHLWL